MKIKNTKRAKRSQFYRKSNCQQPKKKKIVTSLLHWSGIICWAEQVKFVFLVLPVVNVLGLLQEPYQKKNSKIFKSHIPCAREMVWGHLSSHQWRQLSSNMKTIVFSCEDNCLHSWRQLSSSYRSLNNIQQLILLLNARWILKSFIHYYIGPVLGGSRNHKFFFNRARA